MFDCFLFLKLFTDRRRLM